MVILIATVIPSAGAGVLLTATPASATGCPSFPTGTVYGTWVDHSDTNGGVVNATDSANLSAQTLAGTFSFITGNLPLFAGSMVSGTINPDCSFQGAVVGAPEDVYSGAPILPGFGATAASGTWSDPTDSGTWTAALVSAQNSSPSANSLSLGNSGDPIQVNVVSPTAGAMSISSTGSTGGASLPGYTVLGGVVFISAPAGTTTSPLTLTFTIPSTLPASSIALFKDGVQVPACASTTPFIAPDPCEESALGPTGSPGVDTITVLTSSASIWALGVKCGFSIPTTSLPFAFVNQHYSATLSGCGGTAPYRFKKVGRLPRGLTLSRAGVLSGTPSSTGTFSFHVKLTDSTRPKRLRHTTTKTFSITSL
jgi:hypothetical protein